MFAERQYAFRHRIDQILADAQRAGRYRLQHHQRFDLQSRLLSALEDAYQMGTKEPKPPTTEVLP